MIMKKIILTILINVFGLIEINAQTVSQTILKSGTWEKIYPECNYSTTKMHFDKTKMYWDVYYFYNKETITEVDTYYLSDTLPDTFDKSRVGKVNNEKYIVLLNTSMRKGEKREFMTCFEVLNVTNDELRIRDCYVSPNTIGETGEIYVFKKVK